MYRLTVCYGQPQDPAAFDAHYDTTHRELVEKIPGLRRFTAGHCETADGSQPAFYLIADLYFDSKEALRAALSSPEGRAAGEDVPNYATGGATLLIHEEQVIFKYSG
jgi:uncharacterized protein (TIGR02118 family)